MLVHLAIRDIVLIERLDIAFAPGLCALTGETGAGKSILLDSLGLALGARSDSGLVRKGAAGGMVAASFELPPGHPALTLLAEQGIADDDLLVLRRTLAADGKSRAFVNDQPVTVALLKRLGQALVEVQGEREQTTLLEPATHRAMLDAFAGLKDEVGAVRARHGGWRAAAEAFGAAAGEAAEARQNEEFLRHALAELEALDPKPGEEAELSARRSRLVHGQKLAEALERAIASVGGERSVVDRLQAARRALADAAPLAAGTLAEAEAALERAAAEAAEAEAQLSRTADRLELDPALLEAAEERLFALRALARKHRVEIDALASVRERLAEQLAGLERRASSLGRLKRAAEEAEQAYREAAKGLSAARARAGKALDQALGRELAPLKLANARFSVAFEPQAWGGPDGLEAVRFRVAMNPGSPFEPLERVASSGELSRLLLALKVVLAGKGSAATLVFDEIDRGIGGATAEAVGERLARLARHVQVLVVTHSPQVAARANHHFRVTKSTSKAAATTALEALDAETRREEIARMLAGKTVTEEARAAARRLIEGARP